MTRLFAFFSLIFLWSLTACNGQPSSVPKQKEHGEPAAPDVTAFSAGWEEVIQTEPFTIDYLLGRFDPAKHPDFTGVDPQYADAAGYFLRKDTYEAFKRMHAAALKDGVRLVIISATRNFDRQKLIWEGKWTGQRPTTGVKDIVQELPDPVQRALKILEYSSMPGSSRHHWGTDMDLNDLNNSYFETPEGKKIYDWLTAHAAEYGFCQPYSAKGPDRPHGYNEEKWHWSYLPVARKLTGMAREQLTNDMIRGFTGAETAVSIDIVRKYVLGINPECW